MDSFEERLKHLESVAEKLRDGTVPIDEASQLFEEGVILARALEGEMRRLERKIEVLVNKPAIDQTDNDDPPVLELFPELDRSGLDETQ